MTAETIGAIIGSILLTILGTLGVGRIRNGRAGAAAQPVPVTVVAEPQPAQLLNPRLTESGRWPAMSDLCPAHQETIKRVETTHDAVLEIRGDVRTLIGEYRADREDRREDRRTVQELAERLARIGG